VAKALAFYTVVLNAPVKGFTAQALDEMKI
jgi:hypothetical protein